MSSSSSSASSHSGVSALVRRASSLRSPFRSDCLQGQVALITGGGSGIGFEISRQLGLHGARVCIMGRRQVVLDAALASLRAEGIQCTSVRGDVRSSEDAARAVAHTVDSLGALSVLVNSAAGNFLAAAEELQPKGFRTVMEIDALGVFTMCHAAFPHLRARGDSLVLNISALLQRPATFFQAHASAAKAAIDSLTRSLALEWGEYGIRVCGLAPGPIADTAGMAKLGAGVDPAELAQSVPLRRFGSTFDVSMCAVFLCSDAGAFVSGETVAVDGASWLWKPMLATREQIRQFSREAERKQKEKPVGIASKL